MGRVTADPVVCPGCGLPWKEPISKHLPGCLVEDVQYDHYRAAVKS